MGRPTGRVFNIDVRMCDRLVVLFLVERQLREAELVDRISTAGSTDQTQARRDSLKRPLSLSARATLSPSSGSHHL